LAGLSLDAFSYVSGLTTVILALGIGRILVSGGRLLERRISVRLYWVHLMWVVNVFLYLCLQWWVLFRWQAWTDWNFFLFMFLIASPTIVFLLTVILFHDSPSEHSDFKEHFFANHRWFFTLAAVLPALDFVDTFLKGYEHLVAQGVIYPVTLVLVSGLSVVAAVTKNEWYHKFYCVFFFVYILVFISINLNTLA
jgi:hypothetical protein